ncbi:hypothetical protein MNV49_003834 [Pseudohyphozyma bogoriensis]|nr:hypothetical protein MNV49_003834 [Pseudohyphozyma bogoriensis]
MSSLQPEPAPSTSSLPAPNSAPSKPRCAECTPAFSSLSTYSASFCGRTRDSSKPGLNVEGGEARPPLHENPGATEEKSVGRKKRKVQTDHEKNGGDGEIRVEKLGEGGMGNEDEREAEEVVVARFSPSILDDWTKSADRYADWTPVLSQNIPRTIFTDAIPPEQVVETLKPFTIIHAMRERTKLPKEVLEALPNLKFISTTGMRNLGIDLEVASSLGITVSGTISQQGAGNGAAGTVQTTWSLILALARGIVSDVNRLKAGGWQGSELAVSLEGKTLGLVGVGRIGKNIAAVGKAFGMTVVGWSPNFTPERAEEAGVDYAASLEELLSRSDVVSLHIVLAPTTRGLIGAKELALLKESAFLVNTSRGPLVDEEALVEALERKAFAGYGADVFDVEPLPMDNKLRTLPNTVLTPHMGYVDDANYKQCTASSLAAPAESVQRDGTEYEEMSRLADESVEFRAYPRVCFVRRSAYAACQGAHLTTKIRNPNRESYKEALRTYLGKTIQLVAAGFDLDDPSNMIWLSADFHVLLDLYSVFCIVPCDDDLRMLINIVEDVNKDWQRRVNQIYTESRELLFTVQRKSAKFKYRLLILHDDHFLPPQLPLPFLIDGVAVFAKVEDHQLVDCTSSEPLAPFLDPIADFRFATASLNPFLLLINTMMKVREYKAEDTSTPRKLDGHAATTTDLLEKLEELMYFVARPQKGSPAYDVLEEEKAEAAVMDMEKKARELEEHTQSRRSGLRSAGASEGGSARRSEGGSARSGGGKVKDVGDEDVSIELTDAALQEHDELLELEMDRAVCDEALRLLNDPETSYEERRQLMDWAAGGMDGAPPLTKGMEAFYRRTESF